MVFKFRFSSIHFYHIKKPPFQILLYPKGRAFSINILLFFHLRRRLPGILHSNAVLGMRVRQVQHTQEDPF